MSIQEAMQHAAQELLRKYAYKRDAILAQGHGSLKSVDKSIARATKKLLCAHPNVTVRKFTQGKAVCIAYHCPVCKLGGLYPHPDDSTKETTPWLLGQQNPNP